MPTSHLNTRARQQLPSGVTWVAITKLVHNHTSSNNHTYCSYSHPHACTCCNTTYKALRCLLQQQEQPHCFTQQRSHSQSHNCTPPLSDSPLLLIQQGQMTGTISRIHTDTHVCYITCKVTCEAWHTDRHSRTIPFATHSSQIPFTSTFSIANLHIHES